MLVEGFESEAKDFLARCGCKFIEIRKDNNMYAGHSIVFLDRDDEQKSCSEVHIIKSTIKPSEDEIGFQNWSIKMFKKDMELVQFEGTKSLIEDGITRAEKRIQEIEDKLAPWRQRLAELEARK
ncbi:hypothetical protein [Bacillus cereus]|uniref:hypothetical protein n=1 Tax=Bacillus cereus TaxID=1396 RepID=UPI00398038C1